MGEGGITKCHTYSVHSASLNTTGLGMDRTMIELASAADPLQIILELHR